VSTQLVKGWCNITLYPTEEPARLGYRDSQTVTGNFLEIGEALRGRKVRRSKKVK